MLAPRSRPARALVALVASFGAVWLASCAGGPPPEPAAPSASLEGRVLTDRQALSQEELARAIVTLEPIPAAEIEPPDAPAVLRHTDDGLSPALLAVAPGDAVWLLNDGRLFHGAFSYSKPNAFDLGNYGPGEHRRVAFEHPGVVRIHCPFHPDERSIVFVTKTRIVARPEPGGHYAIQGVAPGRYWLRAWAEGLAETRYDVTLRPGERAFRNVVLVPTAPSAATR